MPVSRGYADIIISPTVPLGADVTFSAVNQNAHGASPRSDTVVSKFFFIPPPSSTGNGNPNGQPDCCDNKNNDDKIVAASAGGAVAVVVIAALSFCAWRNHWCGCCGKRDHKESDKTDTLTIVTGASSSPAHPHAPVPAASDAGPPPTRPKASSTATELASVRPMAKGERKETVVIDESKLQQVLGSAKLTLLSDKDPMGEFWFASCVCLPDLTCCA